MKSDVVKKYCKEHLNRILYFFGGEVDSMRVWKRSILLFVGIAVLLLSTLTVSAESDSTGDVWHWKFSETGYSWEHSGGKPNIDITSVSHTITDSEATLTMTVAGTIQDSEKIIYYMHLVGDDETTYYQAFYINGGGAYLLIGAGYQGGELENPVSGNTFTATFEIDDPDATYSVWAYSAEYAETGDESGEAWWDYAPNTYSPWYTGGDGNGGTGGGTPGFETLAVIAAIGVALIILRRRK